MARKTDSPAPGGYQSFIAVGLVMLFVGISAGAMQYKVPTIMVELQGMFNMEPSSTSWLMSIFVSMSIIFAIPAGALAQKIGPKWPIAIAVAIAVVGGIIGVAGNAGPALIVSRAFEGVALTCITVCGPIVVQKCVKPSKIATAMGIWGIWGTAGAVLGEVTSPSALTVLGFAPMWLVYVLVLVAATVIMMLYIRIPADQRRLDAEGVQAAEEKPRYREIFTKNILLFFGGLTGFNVVMIAVLSYVPSILQIQGMDPTLSGFVTTLPMLMAVVISPLFGMISDKVGRCKPILMATMAVLSLMSWLLFTQTGALLWVGAIVMGLIGMGSVGLLLAAFNYALPHPELISIGMGVFIAVQGVGQSVGTMVVQALLGPGMLNWMLAGTVVMVLGLAGVACLAFCKMK